MNTNLYKTIFNQMPASLSIKESEELTENIMGAIQKDSDTKEVKESAEQVLNKYFPLPDDLVDGRIREVIIKAMQEYALRYQSVSEEEKNVYREHGWEAGQKRLKHEYHSESRTPDQWQIDENNAPNKETYLSSFLPKKP